MLSRLVIALLWMLHWLPLSLLAAIGRGFGWLLYCLAGGRRHVVRTNLRLCFPGLDARAREKLARQHFKALGRSLLERSLLWWADEARLKRIVHLQNEAVLRDQLAAGRPVILLTPHFVGLDAGGARIAMEHDAVSIYARQSNAVADYWLYHGRSRFGDQLLLAREEGVRATVKAMRRGRPLYYLPDMNFHTRDAIFAPFFGVPAWTITGLSRLARVAGAVVIPCITRMLPGGQGYVVEFGQPWEDFPSGNVEADTRRMNREIETMVRTMPDQYYWAHRRFKTRPPGEAKPY